jgi:hypothetical protein
MERDGVVLSFRYGKRRVMTDQNQLGSDEAKNALDSVEKMQTAGFRRAVPPQWYGVGISLIVAVGFALYAQNDPGSFPGVFIAVGIALFVGISREKSGGAIGKELPDTRAGKWVLAGVCVFLIALFFGGIFIRRSYDLFWVPLVTGLIAGITIYLLSYSERRYYLARGDDGTRT